MKGIPNKIVNNDIDKLYSLIWTFDNNEYVKKWKIF